MAANHCGSRRAARAEAGRGDGVAGEGAEVDAVHTYSSEGYRVLGTRIPARARVRGPVAGGGGGGGGAGGEASPKLALEGDVVEGADDTAVPEAVLEGDAGGVGDEAAAPEAGLEGTTCEPEAVLVGVTGGVTAVVEVACGAAAEPGTSTKVGPRRRGLSVAGGEVLTCSCAKGKQCSSKYTCWDVMTR
nr:uncharacterized protein LOC127333036 [Lolium perenne]